MDFNSRLMLKVKTLRFRDGITPTPTPTPPHPPPHPSSQAINNSSDYLIYVFHLAILSYFVSCCLFGDYVISFFYLIHISI